MFKKFLSLLSLSVLTVTPITVVSCSNNKLNYSYSLTKNDMSLIKDISEKLNNFSIKKETIIKDVFQELDQQKELIFNAFKEKTKETYSNKEFEMKKKNLINLKFL